MKSSISRQPTLVLPPGWWVIPVSDPKARLASITRLAAHELGDDNEGVKHQARLVSELERAGMLAAQNGAQFFALSLMRRSGIPIPASLVVFRETNSLQAIQVRLQITGGENSVSPGLLGPVLRQVSEVEGPTIEGPKVDGAEADSLRQLQVDYWLAPKDGYGLYHAIFTTPLVEAKTKMLTLFDQIIGTLTKPTPPTTSAQIVDNHHRLAADAIHSGQ